MKSYEEYIKQLKKVEPLPDYSRMHSGIDLKLAGGAAVLQRTGISLAGGLALLVIAFIIYFYTAANFIGKDGDMSSYVFERETFSGDPVMNYIYR